MQYWIDGYNLLFRLPKSKSSLEEKRRHLISEINQQAKELRLEVTIVFDASDPAQIHDRRSHFDCLELIYTRGHMTADEAILEALEHSKKPSQICVVSSDRELTAKARALSAQTLSLKEFFSFLCKKHKKTEENVSWDFQDSPREIARLLEIFSNPPKKDD